MRIVIENERLIVVRDGKTVADTAVEDTNLAEHVSAVVGWATRQRTPGETRADDIEAILVENAPELA